VCVCVRVVAFVSICQHEPRVGYYRRLVFPTTIRARGQDRRHGGHMLHLLAAGARL
jgi:hypothetical protein